MLLNAKSNKQQTFHNRKYRQPASQSRSVCTVMRSHTHNSSPMKNPPHKRKPYRNISISNWKFNNGKVQDHANNSPSLMDESNSPAHFLYSLQQWTSLNEVHVVLFNSVCFLNVSGIFIEFVWVINEYFEVRTIFSSSKWCTILRKQCTQNSMYLQN